MKLFNLCVCLFAMIVMLDRATRSAEAQNINPLKQAVTLDKIVEINLPDNAATVLLGNPDIADILNQSRATIILGGKKIGQTNLLVRDHQDILISTIEIVVNPPEMQNITIFHGTSRADFACAPSCSMVTATASPQQQNSGQAKSTGSKP